GRGRPRLGPRPARGHRTDRRCADRCAAAGLARGRVGRAAGGDPVRAGRRLRADPRLPGDAAATIARGPRQALTDAVFTAFAAAGLWPGLGKTLAGQLAENGIVTPDDVLPSKLAKLPSIGLVRAERLVEAFAGAADRY